MKEIIIHLTGWLNMLLFSVVSLPQIYKTIKTKNVEGVSITPFFILAIANIDAWIYAFLINQTPLLTKYTIGFLVSILYIFVFYKYGSKNGKI